MDSSILKGRKRGIMGEEIIKICPRCGKKTLVIDFEKGIARCTNCGYEERMQTWKNKKLKE
ncbi:hypothetical protein DRJ25_02265 [Candidatus Woesearchaeota archaeon]|nr:MAG: hypothetical protein DRJ25_02265 [Candidatus Woesearchaeota archaeon]